MRIRVPSRKACEKFFIIYELKGCQTAIDFLARYYRVRTMKVVLDGRRAGHDCRACYCENKAFFTKKGLKRLFALHEFYHHLVRVKRLKIPLAIEERNARYYARKVLKRRYFE